MATRQVTLTTDDLDGTILKEGDGKRINFSINGRAYEIDLATGNVEKFYNALTPYVNAARPVRSASKSQGPSRKPRVKSDLDLGAVREWARANGHTVSDLGRMPATIVEAYRAATA